MITVLQAENQVNRAVNRCHLLVGPGTAGPRGTGNRDRTAGHYGTRDREGASCDPVYHVETLRPFIRVFPILY